MESSGGRVTGSSLHAVYHVAMDCWSGEQRGYAVKTYYQHGDRIVQNLHQFNIWRNHPVVTANAIQEP